MLSIRDEEVRTLAQAVMKRRGAPNITAAIKLALRNEVERPVEGTSLYQRAEALRRTALTKAVRPGVPFRKEDRDALWDE